MGHRDESGPNQAFFNVRALDNGHGDGTSFLCLRCPESSLNGPIRGQHRCARCAGAKCRAIGWCVGRRIHGWNGRCAGSANGWPTATNQHTSVDDAAANTGQTAIGLGCACPTRRLWRTGWWIDQLARYTHCTPICRLNRWWNHLDIFATASGKCCAACWNAGDGSSRRQRQCATDRRDGYGRGSDIS